MKIIQTKFKGLLIIKQKIILISAVVCEKHLIKKY